MYLEYGGGISTAVPPVDNLRHHCFIPPFVMK